MYRPYSEVIGRVQVFAQVVDVAGHSVAVLAPVVARVDVVELKQQTLSTLIFHR